MPFLVPPILYEAINITANKPKYRIILIILPNLNLSATAESKNVTRLAIKIGSAGTKNIIINAYKKYNAFPLNIELTMPLGTKNANA